MKSNITFVPVVRSRHKSIKVDLPYPLDFLTEQDLRATGEGRYGMFSAVIPVKKHHSIYGILRSVYSAYGIDGLDRVHLENYTTHVTFWNCSMDAYQCENVFCLELSTTADQVTGV